jgi:hypothetical protein
MKYTKVLCWVDREEAKEIKEAGKGYSNTLVVFAKNYNDFKDKIDEDSFLVISTKKARYKKTFDLVRAFPNNIFYTFYKMDGLPITMSEHYLFIEPNVSPGKRCPQYGPEELFTTFYKAQ